MKRINAHRMTEDFKYAEEVIEKMIEIIDDIKEKRYEKNTGNQRVI